MFLSLFNQTNSKLFLNKNNNDTITSSSSKQNTKLKTKKVRFCKVVQVVLIYSRQELFESKLLSVLFYTRDDYKTFHDDAINEIDEYRLSEPCISRKNHLIKSGIIYDPHHHHSHISGIYGGINNNQPEIDPPKLIKSEVAKLFKTDSILVRDESATTQKRSYFSTSIGMSSPKRDSTSTVTTPSTPTSPMSPQHECRSVEYGYSFPVYGLHSTPLTECSVTVAAIVMYQPFKYPVEEVKCQDDTSYFK